MEWRHWEDEILPGSARFLSALPKQGIAGLNFQTIITFFL
jgi:hypothetical protein